MEFVRVSEVDYAKGQIKVTFPAKDNIVSDWITFYSNEYEMPEVGDLMAVEFEPGKYGNPYTGGICGSWKFFNKDNKPVLQGPDVYYKTMKDDLTIIYNRKEKKLTIQTEKEIEIKAVEKILVKAKKIILSADQTVDINAQTVTINAQTVNINAAQINLGGKTTIGADTSINGNLTVSGTVSATNI